MAQKVNDTSSYLRIEQDKCIGCTACARICPTKTIVGEIKKPHQIDYSKCVACGQCIGVCPTGAIIELKPHQQMIIEAIKNPAKTVIFQTAPSIRATMGEAFELEAGTNVQKRLITALRQFGADYVFDTSLGADFTIVEEANEFLERLKAHLSGDQNVRLPILTSCCPAWVNFFELEYPDLLDIPSSAKSPMQMFSALTKSYFAQKIDKKRDEIVMVSVMPCLSKKYEAARPEFSKDGNPDTDYVISPRDLAQLLKADGIDLKEMQEGEYDNLIFGDPTGGGIIFGRTAGVLEAALRTAYEWYTNETLENVEFKEIRGVVGLRTAELDFKGTKIKVAVSNGFDDARIILNDVRNGNAHYDAIEIMTCQGGCIGGGLHPKGKGPKEALLQKRADVLDIEDSKKAIRKSHKNPYVEKAYEEFLEKPGSHKAHEVLHTQYFSKE
jgi:NADP-reducing hydrogenase subunit HndD